MSHVCTLGGSNTPIRFVDVRLKKKNEEEERKPEEEHSAVYGICVGLVSTTAKRNVFEF